MTVIKMNDYPKAIAVRMIDEMDHSNHEPEDVAKIEDILARMLRQCPWAVKEMMDIGVIEEDYFDHLDGPQASAPEETCKNCRHAITKGTSLLCDWKSPKNIYGEIFAMTGSFIRPCHVDENESCSVWAGKKEEGANNGWS